MTNLGDIWGASDMPEPSKLGKIRKLPGKQGVGRKAQQYAWNCLIDSVHEHYTRLTINGMELHLASETLREYLGINIMDWLDVMTKLPTIPPNFQDQIFELKAKMKKFS